MLRLSSLVPLALALACVASAGCDNTSTPLDAAAPDAYTPPPTDGGGVDAAAPEDAAAPADAFVASDAGPMCPDLDDTWSTTSITGDGCGGPTVSGEVTLDLDTTTCAATFTSLVSKGDPPVNGTVTIGADGSFTGTLTIGTMARTCAGTYDGSVDPETLTLVCDTDACTVTLERLPPPG